MAPAMQSCLELIPADTRRVLLAFSGGLDSCVLLHLLVSSKPSWKLLPWHINHGLLETAMQMEQFCRQRVHDYGLEIRVEQLDLGNIKSNIEAEARRQRYRVFELGSQQGDCILTAHHADDQAETFLLNAMRGSGVAGCPFAPLGFRPLPPAELLRPALRP